ncbi:MAG TPA: hypothetical protein VHQ45_16035 [Gemmatimonadaceae bacterium]|nr:hypothetical protein [Gemmatimonadaceae bacterium]
MLRHVPFFEALAEQVEDTPDWKATSAGLLVLRLVDDWRERGPQAVRRNAWGVHAVRLAVEAIDPGTPVRSILLGLVETVASAERVDVDLLAPHLMAYGRALDFDAQWELGADVMSTLVSYIQPGEHADVATDANMRLGYCHRMLGRLDEAAAAYGAAAHIAAASGDLVKVLRARVADAKLAMARGNLPDAEAILDEAIARAEANRLPAMRAIALHDRAAVAYARGDYEGAVSLAYDALRDTEDPTARDRVLADIAATFTQLGVRSAARDALLVLAATAQEQYTRWMSAINLMELASLDGMELVFEQYRRELARAVLPPDLAASFQFSAGQGYRLLGRHDAARGAFQRAITIALRHRFNQIVFQAEESLAELDRGEQFAAAAAVSVPPSVRTVAHAMGELRELAGIVR